jgi:hypothetical protein
MLACRDTAAVAQAANVAAAAPIMPTMMLMPCEGEAEHAVATVTREPAAMRTWMRPTPVPMRDIAGNGEGDTTCLCAIARPRLLWQWRYALPMAMKTSRLPDADADAGQRRHGDN